MSLGNGQVLERKPHGDGPVTNPHGNGATHDHIDPPHANDKHGSSSNGHTESIDTYTPYTDLGRNVLLAEALVAKVLRPELRAAFGAEIAQNLGMLLSGIEVQFPQLSREQSVLAQIEVRNGIAYVKRDVPVNAFVLQDCGGTETLVRCDLHFGSRDQIGPLGGIGIRSYLTPSLSPESIGATLATIVGEAVYKTHLDGHPEYKLPNGTVSAFLDEPLVIIANSAPRRDKNEGHQGAPFVHARLGHNIFYVGTNSVELSYVKDHINGLVHALPITEEDTYRSKRLPDRFTHWRDGGWSKFGTLEKVAHYVAPAKDQLLIADSFGNLKTGFRKYDPEFRAVACEERVLVKINDRVGVAWLAGALQEGGDLKLVLSPGSTVHDTSNFDNRQVDLFVKNGKGDMALTRFFPEYSNFTAAPDLAPVCGQKVEFIRIDSDSTRLVAQLAGDRETIPWQLAKAEIERGRIS